MTGSTGATGGVGVGTVSAGGGTGGTPAESKRNLARSSGHQDCKGWSSSGSHRIAWEPVVILSKLGLFPLPFSPSGGSCLPIFGGFDPPSFIVISRALYRGGMTILVFTISQDTQTSPC